MKKLFVLSGIIAVALLTGGAGCLSLAGDAPTTQGPAGVFVSQDKGATWQPLSLLPAAEGVKNISGASVYRLVRDPLDPHAIYWLSREQGVFYSYNDGREWRHFEGPLSGGFVYALAVHPENKCILYATNGGQLYGTSDCGRTWNEVYREVRPDARITSVAINPFSPHELLVALSTGDLIQSVDSGKSWNTVKRFEGEINMIAPDPVNKNVWYVASFANGLYRSQDGGATWVSLKDKMKDFSGANDYRIFAISPTIAGEMYWISTYGILMSRDGGDSWRALDLITPPGSAQIYGFAVNPNNDRDIYYTATINTRSTFYKSADGGAHWVTSKLPSGQIPTALSVHATLQNVVYMGFTIPPQQ